MNSSEESNALVNAGGSVKSMVLCVKEGPNQRKLSTLGTATMLGSLPSTMKGAYIHTSGKAATNVSGGRMKKCLGRHRDKRDQLRGRHRRRSEATYSVPYMLDRGCSFLYST